MLRTFSIMRNCLFFFIPIFISCCQTRTGEVISLNEQKVDTIYFKMQRDGILCGVKINNTAYDFIFDTGASNTYLNDKVEYDKVLGKMRFKDSRGIIRSGKRVMLERFMLNNTLFYQFHTYNYSSALVKDGIIGGDILKKMAWKLNFLNNTITFSSEVQNLKPVGKGIMLSLKKNLPYVKLTVNKDTIEFLVDTGFTGFIKANIKEEMIYGPSMKGTIKWIELSPYSNPFSGSKKYVDTCYYSIENISIGSKDLKNEIIRYSNSSKSNLLGMDFFRRFEYVIFDYPNKKLYLGPIGFKSYDYVEKFKSRINTIGFQLQDSPVHTVIAVSDKLIEQKSLNIGDTVLEVNHTSITSRPDKFYQDELKKINGGYSFAPSQWNKLNVQLYCNLDSITIRVKHNSSYRDIRLNRQYNFSHIPDTVQINYTWQLPPLIPGDIGPEFGKEKLLFLPQKILKSKKLSVK